MRAAIPILLAWGALLTSVEKSAAQDTIPPVLLGSWVQDDMGPVATYRRTYYFRPDGSYEFAFTVRPRGAGDQQTLAREDGTFRVRGGRLVIAPRSGPARALPWSVDRDPYVGDVRLVLLRPDGTMDVFVRP
ncbi:MAG TPA: hypothetical protein VNJ71_02450 [Gemmatimonadales bacterium]|nr:hypothetical protein [Gemmatimonadales bacterium]